MIISQILLKILETSECIQNDLILINNYLCNLIKSGMNIRYFLEI